MAEITSAILISVNIILTLMVLWYTLKPRAIQIEEKSQDGDRVSRRQAIMTPSGVFVVPEKRAPVYNDDAALYDREREK